MRILLVIVFISLLGAVFSDWQAHTEEVQHSSFKSQLDAQNKSDTDKSLAACIARGTDFFKAYRERQQAHDRAVDRCKRSVEAF